MASTSNQTMATGNSTKTSPKLFCLCKDPQNGGMIRCNNQKCTIAFFHHSCVSISMRTKGIWYCPFCRANVQNYRIGKWNIEPIMHDPNAIDDHKKFCYCKKFKRGQMIGCDNTNCKFQWFHYQCIRLKVAPDGKWYCARCRAKPGNYSVPKPGTISYIY